MMAPIDPSPVPSFRGVAPTGRAEALAERRKGIESACKEAMLVAFTDALLEASVHAAFDRRHLRRITSRQRGSVATKIEVHHRHQHRPRHTVALIQAIPQHVAPSRTKSTASR
jgi:hypothetical protein